MFLFNYSHLFSNNTTSFPLTTDRTIVHIRDIEMARKYYKNYYSTTQTGKTQIILLAAILNSELGGPLVPLRWTKLQVG